MAKSSGSKQSYAKKQLGAHTSLSLSKPKRSTIAATGAESEAGLQKLFLDAIKDIYWLRNVS